MFDKRVTQEKESNKWFIFNQNNFYLSVLVIESYFKGWSTAGMLLFFHKESVGKIINIESEIKSETPLTVHAKLQPKAVDLLSFPLFNLKIIFPSSA